MCLQIPLMGSSSRPGGLNQTSWREMFLASPPPSVSLPPSAGVRFPLAGSGGEGGVRGHRVHQSAAAGSVRGQGSAPPRSADTPPHPSRAAQLETSLSIDWFIIIFYLLQPPASGASLIAYLGLIMFGEAESWLLIGLTYRRIDLP